MSQLFAAEEDSGQLQMGADTAYHPGVPQMLVVKRRQLRNNLGKHRGRKKMAVRSTFLQVVGGMRLSGLFRKMSRKSSDDDIRGPPAFFSRLRGHTSSAIEGYHAGH